MIANDSLGYYQLSGMGGWFLSHIHKAVIPRINSRVPEAFK